MTITYNRSKEFDEIECLVSNTPLRKIRHIEVPNNVHIYVKEEYKNPTGSHYDRQTVQLFKGKEDTGHIIPGESRLLETTTGSSGASFAWLAKALGYIDPVLIIPSDMPAARISQIKSYGAKIIHSPAGYYIDGLVSKLDEFLDDEDNYNNFVFLNHSEDQEFAPMAMRSLGREILDELSRKDVKPDYLVVALGNGISARGLSEIFVENGVEIVGMEPFESPGVLKNRFPEQFNEKFGQDYQFKSDHIVYGTGPGVKKRIRRIFPNLKEASKLISKIYHPKKEDVLAMKEKLMFSEMLLAGNSSAACLWAAIELAKESPPNSTIVTIMYDAAWRYLDLDTSENYNETDNLNEY